MKRDPWLKAQDMRVRTMLDGLAQVKPVRVHSEKPMTPTAVPKFSKWLVANGAELLSPTNQYELLRIRTERGVSLVYKNKANKITSITNDCKDAWRCYCLQLPWRAFTPVKRRRSSADEQTLLERDGECCFFCAEPLGEDISIEHLVATTHGGPNHISNKFLAHKQCNSNAGHLSAPEKIAIHVKAKSKARAVVAEEVGAAPWDE